MKNVSLLGLTLALSLLSLGNVAWAQCDFTTSSFPAKISPQSTTDIPTPCSPGIRIFSDEPNFVGEHTFTDDNLNEITLKISSYSSGCGQFIAWSVVSSSNLVVDQVVVKGGPTANIYSYGASQPNADGDLHAPVKPDASGYYGISNIDFCFKYVLTVEATAIPTFERNTNWDIDHTVSPASWELFNGDTGTSTFTVNVNKTVTDSRTVSGTVTITNTATSAVQITGVTNEISGSGTLTDACAIEISEANPAIISPGGSLECDYSISLPDGSDRVLTVTVTTAAGGDALGSSATANISFGATPELTGEPGTITVTNSFPDTYGPFDDDAEFTYTKTFFCGEDAGANEEIATINQTGDADDAIVTVNCYGLSVTSTATPSFTRTYAWEIDKSADQSELTLAEGQVFTVNYTVAVGRAGDPGYTDSDWAVSGSITVHNPAPIAAEITKLADLIDSPIVFGPDIEATVTCPTDVSFPYELASGATLECTYSASAAEEATANPFGNLNTATATLRNFEYNSDGEGDAAGSTDFSGVAAVEFSTPTIEIDECIDVSDTNVGSLGTICANAAPAIFSYAYDIGPYEACGDYTVENTASFVTNDQGATGENNWNISVNVPCGGGCTLSPGYWKTHNESFHGGASKKADPTWQLIQPSAENSVFFLSGQSWYDVLWTPPRGNVYYILARAYIAAYLNVINVDNENTADASAVSTELAAALTLFNTYTPAQAATLKGKNRKPWNDLASTLDDFNNGIIGPGKCDEDDSSAEGLAAPDNGLAIQPFTGDQLPTEDYLLEQNRPNPFRGTTTFSFALPTDGKVQLRVYNLNGQVVATLTDSYLEAGRYQLDWQVPAALPSGIYFYRLEAGDTVLTQRMQLQR